MKTIIIILTILLLSSCIPENVANKKVDRLYFVNNCKTDTTFIEGPSYDTAKLKVIATKEFHENNFFLGRVIKLTNEPAPVDGGLVLYLTPDLGIIYSKSTTWPCYKRLHSTNDSIEKRINEYLEHILSKTDFVIEGDTPLNYIKPFEVKTPDSKE